METIREILGLPFDSEERAKYNANANNKKISEVIISGTTISGYKAFSFVWEKSYVKSPVRSANGSIGNLNSYATFITPHLQIDFSLLSIDNYRKIMQLLYAKNEHTVQCYDIVNDRITINNMYFATESMPKIYAIARQLSGQEAPIIELLGVQDYTVELIGTNTKIGAKTVTYNPNLQTLGLVGDISPITIDVVRGQEVIIGDGAEEIVTAQPTNINGETYEFLRWNTEPTYAGTFYRNNDTSFIYDSLILYAQWGSKGTYTLSFDYGLGEPQLDSNNEQIDSREVRYGEKIGTLPVSPIPEVEFDGVKYYPYTRNGWYWTPRITNNSTQVTENTLYSLKGNGTIYQIFTPQNYTLYFNTAGGSEIESITAPYGSNVAVASPTKVGYIFKGWYYDVHFEKNFDGTMPPSSRTLVAKWVKE